MITTDRAHLEFLTTQEAVHIREKEAVFFMRNLRALSKLSTFLCASSFGIIYSRPGYWKSYKVGGMHYGFRDRHAPNTEALESVLMGFTTISICCYAAGWYMRLNGHPPTL